jgi:DNA-binding winged helix-turn-helix (wHTH) protein
LETDVLTYRFGDFTLDVARGCVLRAGVQINLRPKVYEALRYLVQNPDRLIGKPELIAAVWPDTFVTDDSLVQCTVELRRALDDRTHQLLKTVPRRGYLFTGPVIETSSSRTQAQTTPVQTATAHTLESIDPLDVLVPPLAQGPRKLRAPPFPGPD